MDYREYSGLSAYNEEEYDSENSEVDIAEIEARLYSQIYYAPGPDLNEEESAEKVISLLKPGLKSRDSNAVQIDKVKKRKKKVQEKDKSDFNEAGKNIRSILKKAKSKDKVKSNDLTSKTHGKIKHTHKKEKLKDFLSSGPEASEVGGALDDQQKIKKKKKSKGTVIVISDGEGLDHISVSSDNKNAPVISLDSDASLNPHDVINVSDDSSDSDIFEGVVNSKMADIDIQSNLQDAGQNGTADTSDMSLDEIHASMGDGNWSVMDADRYGAKPIVKGRYSSSPARYYPWFSNICCNNCNQKGHLSKYCPVEKKIVCHLCSGDHRFARCPNMMCLNCYLPGHKFTDCTAPRRSNNITCHRCNMTGHMTYECTDLWRMYHLTTEDPKKVDKGTGEVNPKKSCYNCCKQTHFGHECKAKRMDYFRPAVSPLIWSYTSHVPKRTVYIDMRKPIDDQQDDSFNRGVKRNITENGHEAPASKKRMQKRRKKEAAVNGNVNIEANDEDPRLNPSNGIRKSKSYREEKKKLKHAIDQLGLHEAQDRDEKEFRNSQKSKGKGKKGKQKLANHDSAFKSDDKRTNRKADRNINRKLNIARTKPDSQQAKLKKFKSVDFKSKNGFRSVKTVIS